MATPERRLSVPATESGPPETVKLSELNLPTPTVPWPPARKPPEPPPELSRNHALLGRAVVGVASQFNALLTVIQGHAELLAESLPIDGPHAAALQAIAGAARVAGTLSQHLLTLNQTEPTDAAPADLARQLGDLAPLVRGVAGVNVAVAFATAPGLPIASARPAEFTQAVLALVLEARDALAPHGGRLTLSLDPGPAGDTVVLSAADNGPGDPPRALAIGGESEADADPERGATRRVTFRAG